MSPDRDHDREHSEGEDAEEHDRTDGDPNLDTGETSGLGLTEEFARIEAEIESGDPTGEHPAEGAGEQTEEWSHGDGGSGETGEEWIVAEEQGDQQRYGETGGHDAIPDTGEWAEASAAAPAPAADADGADESERSDAGPQAAEPTGESEPEHEPEDEDSSGGEADAGEDDPSAAETERQDSPAPEPEPTAAVFAPVRSDAPTEVRRPPAAGAGVTPIPPSRGTGSGGRPPIPDDELEIKIPSMWLRFLSGSIVIVASVAAAVAVAGLLFVSEIAKSLTPIKGIQEQLTEVESSDPQTVLIIGSDRRAGDAPGDARSDTTMLLRVDPDKNVLSLFSLPRDLKVNIPGYGVAKLNEAYTVGGEKKTLKTVKEFTGVDINHVVEINFDGFADAVNAIDCVYVDVDRDYFNDNSTALSEEETYSAIDINSGYQRLCGLKALQYVRYRHTDTDLVRAARQQDFLREARQKVDPKELLPVPGIGGGLGNELIDIFTKYTRSDIDSSGDILGILKSFIAVRDSTVNEVHFEGDIGDATNTYVTSTSEQVETAMDEFLNGKGSSGDRGGKEAKKPDDTSDKPDKKKKKEKKQSKEDVLAEANVVSTDTLADPGKFEKDARKNNRRLGIPAFFPKVVVPGSEFSTDSRTYEYKNEDDKKVDAYKTVISYAPGGITEYYGVEGTTWDDPPILRNPSETREIDGREFKLFYDGDRLRLVGWSEDGNSYWLNNTLTQSIGESEMLAIASTMGEVK